MTTIDRRSFLGAAAATTAALAAPLRQASAADAKPPVRVGVIYRKGASCFRT